MSSLAILPQYVHVFQKILPFSHFTKMLQDEDEPSENIVNKKQESEPTGEKKEESESKEKDDEVVELPWSEISRI